MPSKGIRNKFYCKVFRINKVSYLSTIFFSGCNLNHIYIFLIGLILLTILLSEYPKLHRVMAILNAIGLKLKSSVMLCRNILKVKLMSHSLGLM